tara:strand:- start:117 stop:347 length:231 start_codon:yes stop_codon:yes gene_type:complete
MEFFNNLMAPLDQKYCIYFYISGLFALFSSVIALASVVPCMMDKKKQQYCFNLVLLSLQMGVGYLVNRMLYNMCIN